MQVSLTGLTDQQMQQADFIEAVDPKNPAYRQRVYGPGQPVAVPPSSKPHAIRVFEVGIDSTNEAQLQELRNRVKAIKGTVL